MKTYGLLFKMHEQSIVKGTKIESSVPLWSLDLSWMVFYLVCNVILSKYK